MYDLRSFIKHMSVSTGRYKGLYTQQKDCTNFANCANKFDCSIILALSVKYIYKQMDDSMIILWMTNIDFSDICSDDNELCL